VLSLRKSNFIASRFVVRNISNVVGMEIERDDYFLVMTAIDSQPDKVHLMANRPSFKDDIK